MSPAILGFILTFPSRLFLLFVHKLIILSGLRIDQWGVSVSQEEWGAASLGGGKEEGDGVLSQGGIGKYGRKAEAVHLCLGDGTQIT